MPRSVPRQGKTSIVMAVKTCRNTRMEIAGDLPEKQALAMWNIGHMDAEKFNELLPKLQELGVVE